ncbi:MAG: acyl-[acyl-carrier-protein] thioesterase [Fretibacterium sp.]
MYVRELTVLPSDASCHGELKLHGLLNHLQDTASLAATGLEGGPTQVLARGYSWVLLRYEVELLQRLPAMDEHFVVKTFHDMNHGYRTLRVFQVETPSGVPLVWAKTSWLLLDLAAGRPVRPAAHLPEFLSCDTEPIDPDFRDIPDFSEPGAGEVHETVYPVRFHDLDANGHVNNAVYFEWIFEATPIDLMTWGPRSISASFRASAKLGDVLTVRVCELEESGSGEVRTFVYEVAGAVRGSGRSLTTFSCSWGPYRS